VNTKAILYNLGILIIFLVLSLLTPLLVSLIYEEGDLYSFIITIGIALVMGISLIVAFRIEHELRIKEGFTLVTLTWLVYTGLGALPFYISGYFPSYTDAFFETMSGFTTTGATILRDIEQLPHGLLFWRSFTHWLGGMGIIVLTLAIFPISGMGGMKLFQNEAPGPELDKLKPRIKETAKILWGVYALITAIEVILLYLAGMNLFESLCHAFGTMGTGGFSTRNASIGFYKSAWIDYIIVVFMIIAGMNFTLHYQVLKGKWGSYWRSSEARFFLGIILAGSVVIGLDLYLSHNYNLSEAVQKSLFQSVSIITTTGYGTDDYELWGTSSQIILLIFMFLGGCAGSTGGAIKIVRIVVLIKFGLSEIKRMIHPQAVLPVRIDHHTVPQDIINNIFSFFLLYLALYVIGVLLMSLMGLDILTSIGSVASCLGNVGPGLGSVGMVDNYAHIPQTGKWILSFLMLIGRLEIYPVIIFLVPIFWKK
jgi:trk system potassium uptake protein TrkH